MDKFVDILNDIILENDTNIVMYAKAAGISHSNLSMYTRGLYLPTVKNLVKLANVYHYPVDYLLGLTDITTYTPAKESKTFYEIFSHLKESNNLTFARISRETKIIDSAFSKWRDGQMPKIENLVKLAEYFSVSIDYLIGRSSS